jgi:hypothetical protein
VEPDQRPAFLAEGRARTGPQPYEDGMKAEVVEQLYRR